MDAEEIMSMFSALKKRAPNATLAFLSERMRAKENHTISMNCIQKQEKKSSNGSFLMLESEETLLECKM